METSLAEDAKRQSRGASTVGSYSLLYPVARGGFGDVYLASTTKPSGEVELVAIKRLRAFGGDDEGSAADAFIQEASLAARMNHPNVVRTFEVGQADGAIFIAMEYLQGPTLRRLSGAVLEADRDVPAFVWAHLVCQLLDGLHYLHELRDSHGVPLGFVHQDVSPENICVTFDGRVVLFDFGAGVQSALPSVSGEVFKGKLGYFAPEAFESVVVDRRYDVYSAGVILWELLAGRRIPRECRRIEGNPEPIPLLSSVMPGVSPELEAVVARACERMVGSRYATALEMRDEIQAFLSKKGVSYGRSALSAMTLELFSEERRRIEAVARICARGAVENRSPAPVVVPMRRPMRSEQVSLSDLETETYSKSGPAITVIPPPGTALTQGPSGEETRSPSRGIQALVEEQVSQFRSPVVIEVTETSDSTPSEGVQESAPSTSQEPRRPLWMGDGIMTSAGLLLQGALPPTFQLSEYTEAFVAYLERLRFLRYGVSFATGVVWVLVVAYVVRACGLAF